MGKEKGGKEKKKERREIEERWRSQ